MPPGTPTATAKDDVPGKRRRALPLVAGVLLVTVLDPTCESDVLEMLAKATAVVTTSRRERSSERSDTRNDDASKAPRRTDKGAFTTRHAARPAALAQS